MRAYLEVAPYSDVFQPVGAYNDTISQLLEQRKRLFNGLSPGIRGEKPEKNWEVLN